MIAELAFFSSPHYLQTKKGVHGRRSVFQSPIDFFYEPKNRLPSDEEVDEEMFEYKIRSARSWQSHSFKVIFVGHYSSVTT